MTQIQFNYEYVFHWLPVASQLQNADTLVSSTRFDKFLLGVESWGSGGRKSPSGVQGSYIDEIYGTWFFYRILCCRCIDCRSIWQLNLFTIKLTLCLCPGTKWRIFWIW